MPTNMQMRHYLEHVKWFKSQVAQLLAVDHTVVGKYHQYFDEIPALGAVDIKEIKHSKRYLLMAAMFHAQLGKVLDDEVDIFVPKLREQHSRSCPRITANELQDANTIKISWVEQYLMNFK